MKTALRRAFDAMPQLLPFIGLFFIVSGIVGLVFIQKPLENSQDPRSQASIEGGTVEVASLTDESSDLETLGEETTISLGFNTYNTPVTELAVVFNIITNTTDEIELQIPELEGMEISSELEATEDGFIAEVVLTPLGGGYFVSNFDLKFLELHFTPSETGDFELNFDREESVALHANTAADILSHIPAFSYTIVEAQDDSDTIKSCNERCNSNAECESGYRCYDLGDESRCRLAVNPSSSSCDAEDNSEKSQCNEDCESDINCASGLSCFENSCRNPKNLTSTSCSDPDTQSSSSNEEIDVQSCNESCNSNAGCAVNFRCYQGNCRLATNPSSTSCSASTEKTVSDRYEQDTANNNTTTEDNAPETEEASDSAEATAAAGPEPTATPTPLPTTPPQETSNADEQLPMLIIIIGVGLVAVGIAAIIIVRAMKKKSSGPTTPPGSNNQQISAAPPDILPGSSPTTETQPAESPPVSEIDKGPAAEAGQKPASQSAETDKSSMASRLKQKGISPPKSEK